MSKALYRSLQHPTEDGSTSSSMTFYPPMRDTQRWWKLSRGKRGYILTADQSDAGSVGIFSRRTNQTQEAR
eukprot:6220646-Pyramimonas_sp.AAC.5